MRSILLVLPALAALAACDGGTQAGGVTADEAEADGNIVGNSSSSKPGDEAAGEDAADDGTPAPTEIPVAMRGRWGMVPADCDPARSDAKGLLEISGRELEFYESVGTLDTVQDGGPTRIRASFDFEGEGMTWERDVTLDVEDDGATLIRQEYGDDAAPEPFRYAKCN